MGSGVTIASLRAAQVGGRPRVGIGIPAHGRNTGRCARRVTRTFCPNSFLDSRNQSEIRNEIGCYRCHNPPYTSEAEDTFSTTCPPGLDRPSSKLSMSICLLPHILTQLIAQQFGQAAAAETPRTLLPSSRGDADEPLGRAINNESVTFTHRSTRATAGDGPATSRTRRFGRFSESWKCNTQPREPGRTGLHLHHSATGLLDHAGPRVHAEDVLLAHRRLAQGAAAAALHMLHEGLVIRGRLRVVVGAGVERPVAQHRGVLLDHTLALEVRQVGQVIGGAVVHQQRIKGAWGGWRYAGVMGVERRGIGELGRASRPQWQPARRRALRSSEARTESGRRSQPPREPAPAPMCDS